MSRGRRIGQPGRDGDGDGTRRARGRPTLLADVLWWVALTLALRSFFEPVMVSYYPWPPMAVALIAGRDARAGGACCAAGLLAGGLTARRPGPVARRYWIWWVPIVAGLAVLLAIAGQGPSALTPAGA